MAIQSADIDSPNCFDSYQNNIGGIGQSVAAFMCFRSICFGSAIIARNFTETSCDLVHWWQGLVIWVRKWTSFLVPYALLYVSPIGALRSFHRDYWLTLVL